VTLNGPSPFKKLSSLRYIFVVGKSRYFKCRVLIETEDNLCTCDTLLLERMCSGSRDLFRFLEISVNISETVQDRDIVAVEH